MTFYLGHAQLRGTTDLTIRDGAQNISGAAHEYLCGEENLLENWRPSLSLDFLLEVCLVLFKSSLFGRCFLCIISILLLLVPSPKIFLLSFSLLICFLELLLIFEDL